MMKIKHFLSWILRVFLLLSISNLQAETIHSDAFKAEALEIRKTNGIAYMTGGIGEDEVKEMRTQAKKFTLNLLFSEGSRGRYATNINVNIYNETNQLVFRILGAKPLLYVNLPAGNYTVLANNNGDKLRHKFYTVANNNLKIILNWKEIIVEEDLLFGE